MRRPARAAGPRWWLLGAVILVAAGTLAGCGEPEPEAAPEIAAAPDRFQAPSAFSSYRYTLVVEASTDLMDLSELPAGLDVEGLVLRISLEGERVNPDREYVRSQSSFGFLSLERETIVIGDQLWSRQAGGAWRQRGTLTSPEDLLGQDVQLSPAVIFGDDNPELLQRITDDLEARPHTTEFVRGRETRRWTLTQDWLFEYEEEFGLVMPGLRWPEHVTIDIWADVEHRIGTRLTVTAATATNPQALHLEMELFDFNDPDIRVEVPRGAIGP
jgi:hypothetical protein